MCACGEGVMVSMHKHTDFSSAKLNTSNIMREEGFFLNFVREIPSSFNIKILRAFFTYNFPDYTIINHLLSRSYIKSSAMIRYIKEPSSQLYVFFSSRLIPNRIHRIIMVDGNQYCLCSIQS